MDLRPAVTEADLRPYEPFLRRLYLPFPVHAALGFDHDDLRSECRIQALVALRRYREKDHQTTAGERAYTRAAIRSRLLDLLRRASASIRKPDDATWGHMHAVCDASFGTPLALTASVEDDFIEDERVAMFAHALRGLRRQLPADRLKEIQDHDEGALFPISNATDCRIRRSRSDARRILGARTFISFETQLTPEPPVPIEINKLPPAHLARIALLHKRVIEESTDHESLITIVEDINTNPDDGQIQAYPSCFAAEYEDDDPDCAACDYINECKPCVGGPYAVPAIEAQLVQIGMMTDLPPPPAAKPPAVKPDEVITAPAPPATKEVPAFSREDAVERMEKDLGAGYGVSWLATMGGEAWGNIEIHHEGWPKHLRVHGIPKNRKAAKPEIGTWLVVTDVEGEFGPSKNRKEAVARANEKAAASKDVLTTECFTGDDVDAMNDDEFEASAKPAEVLESVETIVAKPPAVVAKPPNKKKVAAKKKATPPAKATPPKKAKRKTKTAQLQPKATPPKKKAPSKRGKASKAPPSNDGRYQPLSDRRGVFREGKNDYALKSDGERWIRLPQGSALELAALPVGTTLRRIYSRPGSETKYLYVVKKIQDGPTTRAASGRQRKRDGQWRVIAVYRAADAGRTKAGKLKEKRGAKGLKSHKLPESGQLIGFEGSVNQITAALTGSNSWSGSRFFNVVPPELDPGNDAFAPDKAKLKSAYEYAN